MARVNLGEDPAGERTIERQSKTLSDLIEAYMSEIIRPKRRPRTAVLFDGFADNHVKPALGTRKANSITRADTVKLHRTIGKKHETTANRILTFLSAVYAFGSRSGHLPEDYRNPARGIEKFREQGRERYLTADELLRLGEALRLAESLGIPWDPSPNKVVKHAPKKENRRVKIDPFAVAALRLLLFTGARLREILTSNGHTSTFSGGCYFFQTPRREKRPLCLASRRSEFWRSYPASGNTSL